jgi:hypothetical protein
MRLQEARISNHRIKHILSELNHAPASELMENSTNV